MSQPTGTLVSTPMGLVAIETLCNGDRVVSYDNDTALIVGILSGLAMKVARSHYEGKLYGVCVDGRQTWATEEHLFNVRWPMKYEGGERVISQVAACNLFVDLMEVPVPVSGNRTTWTPITFLEAADYIGPVYSLAVVCNHHYIADGIVIRGGSRSSSLSSKSASPMKIDKSAYGKDRAIRPLEDCFQSNPNIGFKVVSSMLEGVGVMVPPATTEKAKAGIEARNFCMSTIETGG